MTPLELIKRGAVLSAAVPGRACMLLGPHVVVERGRLLFYDLAAERARTLKFDAYGGGENGAIWLVQAGDQVARLSPVATESAEAEIAWQQHWARQPAEHQNRLLERMKTAIEAVWE